MISKNEIRKLVESYGCNNEEEETKFIETLYNRWLLEPIDMLLWCPQCHQRHIDGPEFTKVHHTHACQHCGMTWRPAIVATTGVEFLPGFKNEEKEEPKVHSCVGPLLDPPVKCDGYPAWRKTANHAITTCNGNYQDFTELGRQGWEPNCDPPPTKCDVGGLSTIAQMVEEST